MATPRKNDTFFTRASGHLLSRKRGSKGGREHNQNIYDEACRTKLGRTSVVRVVLAQSTPRQPAREVGIFRVRTYSHAVLTWAIARSAAPHDGSASPGVSQARRSPIFPRSSGQYGSSCDGDVSAGVGSMRRCVRRVPSPVRMRPFTRRSSWVTCSWPSGRALRGSTSGTSRCFRFLWNGPVMYSPTRSPTRRTRARSCGRSQKDVSRARSPTGTAHDTPAPLR